MRARLRLVGSTACAWGERSADADPRVKRRMERRRARGSLRLDVGCPDDLAPFLGFVGDELSEIGGRAAKHGAAQIGEPRLDLGVRESRVDLFVELVNDFSGRVPGRADAVPGAR